MDAFREAENQYRYQVDQELNFLKQHFILSNESDLEALQHALLAKVEVDRKNMDTLKQLLKGYTLSKTLTKPLRYTQLPRILQTTRFLIENHLEPLMNPKALPVEGYDHTYDVNQVTWLGDPAPDAFYGTPRVTPLKDAYLRLFLKRKRLHSLHEVEDVLPGWLNHTVLANPHPLPLTPINRQRLSRV